MLLHIKRIYEPYSETDGYRILVDRLWPRGIRKEDARIDLWLKEAAPSTELRQWFNHEPQRWIRFKARYFAELDANRHHIEPILAALEKSAVTLVYASRDEQYNQAVALREYISLSTSTK